MSAAKKILPALLSVLLLLVMAIFLSDPVRYGKSILNGFSLWAAGVLPATFPFLFLTALLTGLPSFSFLANRLSPLTGKIYRVSGAGGGIALLAALSGYPVGARAVFDFKDRLAPDERFRVACLATTSGPVFLVGTVGCMMYGSAKAGWIMLLCHLLAVRAVCFFLRFGAKPPRDSALPQRERADLFYESLSSAVISVLCVGGLIALFTCFGQMLSDLGVFRAIAPLFGGRERIAEGLVRGLIEMTTGCSVLAGESTPLSVALSCALVTFGGVCVLCQQTAFLSRAQVPVFPFLGVKFLQALLAFLLAFGLSFLLL